VVGVGAPAALGMGAVKSFLSGNHLAGLGLGLGALAVGGTVGTMALMGAAMSTDAGDTTGMNAYMAGAGISTLAAGVAIFA